MFGGSGDDWLFGNDGIDRLWGDRGNDVSNGGRGNDIHIGGLGNDIFEFGSRLLNGVEVGSSQVGNDVIADLKLGNDFIRLTDGISISAVTQNYFGGPLDTAGNLTSDDVLDTKLELSREGAVVGTGGLEVDACLFDLAPGAVQFEKKAFGLRQLRTCLRLILKQGGVEGEGTRFDRLPLRQSLSPLMAKDRELPLLGRQHELGDDIASLNRSIGGRKECHIRIPA